MFIFFQEKTWEDIIPEDERKKMEEEQRQQELLDLELGPRSRKTIKQVSHLIYSKANICITDKYIFV